MRLRLLRVCAVVALGLGSICVPGAFGAGCDAGQGPLRVRKILVDVEPAAERLGRDKVRAIVEDVAGSVRGLRMVKDGRGDGAVMRVRVDGFSASMDDSELPRTTLELSVDVTGLPGEAQGSFHGQAVAAGSGVVDTRNLVERALRDALAQVLLTRAAADLASDELIGWLQSADASSNQKRRAIRVLGTRREPRAIPALGQLLADDNNELKPLVLGALAHIGDPAGLDPVLAYAERQSPTVVKQCIEAVRAMGTRPGKAWLFTLSTGHPDEDVQRLAGAALAWVEGREAVEGTDPARGRTVAETTRGPSVEAVR